MAVLNFTAVPGQVPGTMISALAASTSTAEQAFGKNTIFTINSDKDVTIKFGKPGLSDASASDYRIPANVPLVWDVGNSYTSFKLFNLSVNPANIYIMILSKF